MRGRARLGAVAGRYLPDLVYGANDGIITTFAVVSGVVGAALSERVILILGFANLLADGFSMGASNYLARRSSAATAGDDRLPAVKHGLATLVGFVTAGVLPLAAYLLPLPHEHRFAAAVAIAAGTLTVVGASRSAVTKAGWFRSGLEMLVVGVFAGAVAYGIGAFAATLA